MNINWKIVSEALLGSFLVVMIVSFVYLSYLYGYKKGSYDFSIECNDALSQVSSSMEMNKMVPNQVIPTTPVSSQNTPTTRFEWGGPELWEAVNNTRIENGVNPLKQQDELCTIASIRLNELLELGKLDGHEGFSNLSERRPDLRWIFEKYTISEFLATGASSADETVKLWLNTLAHKKLLTGGEYSFGCVYAQDTFAVAIAAY